MLIPAGALVQNGAQRGHGVVLWEITDVVRSVVLVCEGERGAVLQRADVGVKPARTRHCCNATYALVREGPCVEDSSWLRHASTECEVGVAAVVLQPPARSENDSECGDGKQGLRFITLR